MSRSLAHIFELTFGVCLCLYALAVRAYFSRLDAHFEELPSLLKRKTRKPDTRKLRELSAFVAFVIRGEHKKLHDKKLDALVICLRVLAIILIVILLAIIWIDPNSLPPD
jgi:hypothetical protein